MTTTIDVTDGQDDGVVRVRLTGDVDFYSAADLRRLADTIEDLGDVREIRVHLDRVAFLSVEGLGALTRLGAIATERGVGVRIMGARGQPRRLMQQTGVHRLLGGEPHRASLPT
jgi:anti-anti-sigma factor